MSTGPPGGNPTKRRVVERIAWDCADVQMAGATDATPTAPVNASRRRLLIILLIMALRPCCRLVIARHAFLATLSGFAAATSWFQPPMTALDELW